MVTAVLPLDPANGGCCSGCGVVDVGSIVRLNDVVREDGAVMLVDEGSGDRFRTTFSTFKSGLLLVVVSSTSLDDVTVEQGCSSSFSFSGVLETKC